MPQHVKPESFPTTASHRDVIGRCSAAILNLATSGDLKMLALLAKRLVQTNGRTRNTSYSCDLCCKNLIVGPGGRDTAKRCPVVGAGLIQLTEDTKARLNTKP